jgi:hypothetical protein
MERISCFRVEKLDDVKGLAVPVSIEPRCHSNTPMSIAYAQSLQITESHMQIRAETASMVHQHLEQNTRGFFILPRIPRI